MKYLVIGQPREESCLAGKMVHVKIATGPSKAREINEIKKMNWQATVVRLPRKITIVIDKYDNFIIVSGEVERWTRLADIEVVSIDFNKITSAAEAVDAALSRSRVKLLEAVLKEIKLELK